MASNQIRHRQDRVKTIIWVKPHCHQTSKAELGKALKIDTAPEGLAAASGNTSAWPYLQRHDWHVGKIFSRRVTLMADTVTAKRRSEIMSNIRAKGMKPEMAVRRITHAMGYRYRLHCKNLPGKPDLVFPSRRKVIFVHGCFWHQHANPACKIARRPRSNQDYWLPKLERNVARDTQHQASLTELGWDVLVLWECDVEAGAGIADRIREFLELP